MSNKILLVDDTPVVLDFLEFVFQQAGFEVLRSPSGEFALTLTLEERPDILLVDVLMPGMDGLEVCRQLRAMPETARVPILLYSAVVREDVEPAARAAGADEFLGKTLNHAELVDRVRDWLAVVARPGGVGQSAMVDLALDLLELLDVELVWLLGAKGEGLVHLAAASERGEQQAQRFVELAGRGPFAVGSSTPIGEVLTAGRPTLNQLLSHLREREGGEALVRAAEALGIRALSIVPLTGVRGERGALVFAAPRTLAAPHGWAAAVAVASRYASLGLSCLDALRIANEGDTKWRPQSASAS